MTKERLVAGMGIVVALAVMGFGCGGGGNDAADGDVSPLVGTWTAMMGADDPADPDIATVLTINANNTYSITENGIAAENSPGTWVVDGNMFTMNGPLDSQTVQFVLDGNTMTVSGSEGGSIVFTRS